MVSLRITCAQELVGSLETFDTTDASLQSSIPVMASCKRNLLMVSLRTSVNAAGYLLAEKVSDFTDADVQKLTDPLMPLVHKSRGLQVTNPDLLCPGLLRMQCVCTPILETACVVAQSCMPCADIELNCPGSCCPKESAS